MTPLGSSLSQTSINKGHNSLRKLNFRRDNNNQRGGYLQTIESEGNLPTQYGKNRSSYLKGSGGGSIHSFESLKSDESYNLKEDPKVEDEEEKISGHSSYNNYMHSRINTEMQQKAHAGDPDVQTDALGRQQVFSYEKQNQGKVDLT